MYVIFIWCFMLLAQVSAFSQCSNNCSTYSPQVGKEYKRNFIACQVQSEICNLVGKNVPTENPNPNILNHGVYLYIDPDSNTVKIGLNVTWQMVQTASIKRIKGHKLEIRNKNHLPDKTFMTYFCFQDQLNFNSHAHAKFFYDCYGDEVGPTVYAGEEYSVSVTNVNNINREINKNITIKVPKCTDKRMNIATECVLQSQLRSTVMTKTCGEKSIVYNYNMPSEYGKTVTITVLRLGDTNNLATVKTDYRMQNQTNSTVIIPVSHKNSNYSVIAKGENMERYVLEDVVFVGECHLESISLIIGVVIGAVVLLSGLIILLWARRKLESTEVPIKDEAETPILPPVDIPDKKVFILYSSKNKTHEKLVEAFASYLQKDLGLTVMLECWNQIIKSMSIADWFIETIDSYDKVLTVWSLEAMEEWKNKDNGNCHVNNSIAPALIHIKRKLGPIENNQKYFFTYFEHDSYDVVPEAWRNMHLQHYCLMDNFGELYFRIIEQEKYMPESSVEINRIEVDENGKWMPIHYGLKLKMALDHVQDENGTGTMATVNNGTSATLNYSATPAINYIQIIPPPPVMLPEESGHCPYHRGLENRLNGGLYEGL